MAAEELRSFSTLGCRVDPLMRVVTNADGKATRLEPKACDLLLFLSAHPNEVFSVEQLIEHVWDAKFVTGDVVMVAISALRQALGDSAKQPRFIETLRGRGYRWIAKVEETAGEAARHHIGNEGSAPHVVAGGLARRSLATLAALLILAGGCAWFLLRRPTPMPTIDKTQEVLRAHARGLFFIDRRTRADMEKAVVEFRHAIAVEPRFAEPHAALAEALVRSMEMANEIRPEKEAEARREALVAMQLDPQLAIAHAAQASIAFVLDRDMAAAEQSFRRAVDLDPSVPSVRRRYAYLLAANGRFDEAVAHARAAAQLAPASSSTFADLGWIEVVAGDPKDAERDTREAVRLDPQNAGAMTGLAYILDARGASGEAWSAYRSALPLIGVPAAGIAKTDAIFATKGMRGVYEAWGARPGAPKFFAAMCLARAGRERDALPLLTESVERREPATLWIAVHPAFAPLHREAAFVALAKRAGVM